MVVVGGRGTGNDDSAPIIRKSLVKHESKSK